MCGPYNELRESLRDSPLIRVIVSGVIIIAWAAFGTMLMIVLTREFQILTVVIAGCIGLFFLASLVMIVAGIHELCRKWQAQVVPSTNSLGATASRGVVEGETFEAANPLRTNA